MLELAPELMLARYWYAFCIAIPSMTLVYEIFFAQVKNIWWLKIGVMPQAGNGAGNNHRQSQCGNF